MRLTKRFSQAFERALELHGDQERKGSGIPYISHLMGVAAIALEYGANEDEAIAALLHDAAEDAGGIDTLNLIRDEFGAVVADVVGQCSDTFQTPKPPWKKRKEDYIAHLRAASCSARLVSACDKLHNLRSIIRDYRLLGEKLWDRFRGGREGTLWYYTALVEEFGERGPDDLSKELKRVLNELNSLVAVKDGK